MFMDYLPGIFMVTEQWTGWLARTGTVVIASLLVILCLLSWLTNLIALPGNWIAVAMLTLYVWLGPEQGRAAIDGIALVSAFLLALVGEIFEFMASAFGRSGPERVDGRRSMP